MKRSVPRLKGAAKKLARGEFIGQHVVIHRANDTGIQGLEGIIVDETMKTFTLDVGGRMMQLAKHGATWRFGDVDIVGEAIRFRSEDRTKKVR